MNSVKKLVEYLICPGEICLHENYVNKGCFRTFYNDEIGIEHNFSFAVEDSWISDIYSRTYHVPSFCNIVALEDAELLQISQTDLEQFYKKYQSLSISSVYLTGWYLILNTCMHFFRKMFKDHTGRS